MRAGTQVVDKRRDEIATLEAQMLRAGFDVYLVNWGAPRSERLGMRVDDYVADPIPQCITQMQAHSGEREVSLAADVAAVTRNWRRSTSASKRRVVRDPDSPGA